MHAFVLKHLKGFICLGLTLVTVAVYYVVLGHDLMVYDDDLYVTSNPHVRQGLTWETVWWAFSSFHVANWHPLTWLSHALDCQLYGLQPGGHHFTNLIFHVINTLLVFHLFHRLTGRIWPSVWAAGIFALHPMHVESVAWVAERKDVLSGLFFLLTLLAYTRYAGLAKSGNKERWWMYIVTFLLFVCGLMSKPMLVTVPCVLLLLDFWPLNRIQTSNFSNQVLKRLLLEKLPFFLLTAISCWITIVAQGKDRAIISTENYSLAERLMQVPVSYGWYVLKFFWPSNLSIQYWVWTNVVQSWALTLLAGVAVLGISAMGVWFSKRHPYFIVGWLWFLVMLVPVIGVLQVGIQLHNNRYSYLPYIGLSLVVGWGVSTDWPTLRRSCRIAVWMLAMGSLLMSGFLTVRELTHWKNGRVLFERAVELDRESSQAWFSLGVEYDKVGDKAKAQECYEKAISVSTERTFNYGAWFSLGLLHEQQGRFEQARQAYEAALQAKSAQIDEVYNQLGGVCLKLKDYPAAVAEYRRSLELTPNQTPVQISLGKALFENGEPEVAIHEFNAVLQQHPQNAEAEIELATAYARSRRPSDAVTHFRRAVSLNTNSVEALNNLAWILATTQVSDIRSGEEAVRLARQACRLTECREAVYLGTLAAALAEIGSFDEAITTARRACELANKKGEHDLERRNQELLQLYQAHQPVRE